MHVSINNLALVMSYKITLRIIFFWVNREMRLCIYIDIYRTIEKFSFASSEYLMKRVGAMEIDFLDFLDTLSGRAGNIGEMTKSDFESKRRFPNFRIENTINWREDEARLIASVIRIRRSMVR